MTGFFLKSWPFTFLLIVFWLLGFSNLAKASERGTRENPLRMMFVPSGDSQVILKEGQEIAHQLRRATGLHFKTSVATSYAAVIEAARHAQSI